jgi:hypothetical protein
MNAGDETNITDIELLPDGRVYVFGASAEVLAVLDELQCGSDSQIRQRLDPSARISSNTCMSTASKTGTQHVRPHE